MRLTTFAARPRQVTLAGMPMTVHKFTLGDLAEIEDWLQSAIPRPEPGDDGIPGGWPPTFDTEAGLALVASGEGIAQLLFVALRRSLDGLSIEQAREIAGAMSVEEFGPFYAAAFPEPSDGPAEEGPRRRVNWHKRINDIASVYKYTPAEILDLPLDQFFALGREPEGDGPMENWAIPIRKPEDLDRLWAERQARMAGKAGDTDAAGTATATGEST